MSEVQTQFSFSNPEVLAINTGDEPQKPDDDPAHRLGRPSGSSPPNPREKAALEYAKRGWSVLPIEPRGKKPLLQSWTDYQLQIATEDEIMGWFQTWPDANVAIVTGQVSGLVVLDVDGNAGRSSMTDREVPVSYSAQIN